MYQNLGAKPKKIEVLQELRFLNYVLSDNIVIFSQMISLLVKTKLKKKILVSKLLVKPMYDNVIVR